MRWTGVADAFGTRHWGCEIVEVTGVGSAIFEFLIIDNHFYTLHFI